ncbi:unnamed protein product [Sphagnum troendelagicum]|uniref:HTH myb-type domain-containing protein n=1 Tax=Sphagnum jensenii TaxID=128206 RepID=A0ABP0WG27_9BRYO
MESPADLTLGSAHTASSSYTNATNTVNGLKSSLSFVGDHLERIRRIEEYLQALEDERRKIEAFKRELPLCMQLLEETIESSKEQLAENGVLPTTQLPVGAAVVSSPSRLRGLEFMPLKAQAWERQQQKDEGDDDDQEGDGSECPGGVDIEKLTWMTEAQLWTQQLEPSSELHCESEQEQCSVTSSRFELFSSKQPPAGAFLPFVGEQQVVTAAPPPSGSTTGTTGSGADLSLSSLDHVSSPNGNGFGGAESEVGSIDVTRLRTPDQILDAQGCNLGIRPQSNGVSEAGSTRVFGSQSQRKSRRCWTAELHRRFVGALQQLGGSQVATPKQIRELMKVDGLTNDEVKSHLQKYRLHTRRRSTSSQSVSLEAPQMVGMWVPVEYAVAQAAAQPTSGGPLQLSSQLSGGAQEVSIEDSGGGDVKSDSTSWKSCQLDDIEGKEIGRSIQHTVKQDNNGQQIKR